MAPASASATNPPPPRATSAAFDAAAMTDGSSTTIGTMMSRPFTRKLRPTPNGSANVPTAFSTMMSATSSGSASAASSTARSSGERPKASDSFCRRSSTVSR
jgi:hypothetical protein